jgi:uncharacterized membrane protein
LLRQWAVPSEAGFRRPVNFSDAVVAIAITLLVLPLVDSASSIGTAGLGKFFQDNETRLLAFGLSFAVIGSFWWGQHQRFEKVRSYNSVLMWGMFLWLLSIVFLPFPTELIGTVKKSTVAVHAIYVGTMLGTAIGALIQQWAIVRWPELQDEAQAGTATLDSAVVLTGFMGVALVMTVAVPSVGLWPLLVLLLSRRLEHLLATRRARAPRADS